MAQANRSGSATEEIQNLRHVDVKMEWIRTSFLVLLVITSSRLLAAMPDQETDLRADVCRAETDYEAREAYEKYFRYVGTASFRRLMADENTGIALQAAWEAFKKPITRTKKIAGRTERIYSPDELAKFLEFVKARTKAPIPKWWSRQILDVELGDTRHGFVVSNAAEWKLLRKSMAGSYVYFPAELERSVDVLHYSCDGMKFEFPESLFQSYRPNTYAGHLGKTQSIIAGFNSDVGSGYQLAAFQTGDKTPKWVAEVWGGGILFGGPGRHYIEIAENDGTIFVFGAELFSMYLEAFDAKTGNSRYRFSTSYWLNHSEGWNLNLIGLKSTEKP